MATSDLKTEVQTRIDALTYSSGTLQAAEVMQGAVDAFGLGCDLTNITSVYNSMEAAVTSSTPANDMTALNVASIALGITSNSSGSGSDTSQIIGSLKTLHVDDVDGLFTAPNGDEWLKTGVIETNVSMYPDAKNSAPASSQTGGVYNNKNFTVTPENSVRTVCWDGDNYWIAGTGLQTVVEYTPDGTATGNSFTYSGSPVANVTGIAWDGSHFWLTSGGTGIYKFSKNGYTGSFHTLLENYWFIEWDGEFFWMQQYSGTELVKYTSEGIYTNYSIDVGSDTGLFQTKGTSWDGIYFYIYGVNKIIYRFNSEWIYTGESFSTSEVNTPQGFCYGDSEFLIVDSFSDSVYGYTDFEPFVGGQYTGTSFSVAAQSTAFTCIAWDGTHFWIPDTGTDSVYKYNADGTSAGFNFDLTADVVYNASGMVYSGGYLWIIDYNKGVYKYTTDGTLQENFPVPEIGQHTGIEVVNGFIYLVSKTDTNVHKYTLAGVYLGVAFSFSSEVSDVRGIAWDGTNFYIQGATEIYLYDLAGNYLNISFSVADTPWDISYDGTHIWAISSSGGIAKAYTGYAPYVGIPTAEYDISSGYPKYLKIKKGGA